MQHSGTASDLSDYSNEPVLVRYIYSPRVDFPEIVCLCGSTRFVDVFMEEGKRLSLDRKIVLTIAIVKSSHPDAGPMDHLAEYMGQNVVELLDELHFRKIDLADEVRVLNVGGYIGESTRNEINYAISRHKKITYLEPIE